LSCQSLPVRDVVGFAGIDGIRADLVSRIFLKQIGIVFRLFIRKQPTSFFFRGNIMASLSERYRPKHFAAVVGQDEAIQQIQRVLAREWGGRAWWISGGSGTGKSTLAYIIAKEGADDFFIEELDAQLLTPASLKGIEEEMRYSSLSAKKGKAYIVNEAHGISAAVRRQLLVTLERLPAHAVFIFTTTTAAQKTLFGDDGDHAPLISRCTQVSLQSGDETRYAMAMRAKKIAMAENIDGLPDEVYLDAVHQCRGNLRMLLANIESGRFVQDAEQRSAWREELESLASDGRKAAVKRKAELEELLSL
jgi:replication-associated recombination protein RarA